MTFSLRSSWLKSIPSSTRAMLMPSPVMPSAQTGSTFMSSPLVISQVPLAPVKGVPNLRVVQRICLCLAVFQECGISGVLESVDGIGHRVRPDSEELEDPDVVSAGAEVVSNDPETVGPTIGV